jgi:UDPglucose--hexose-1-phosphate uridylyltransferase
VLQRHDLIRPDGRHLYVYGSLHGRLPEGHGESPAPSDVHKRLDVFTDTWVAIAPARNARPLDSSAGESGASSCPFCPGGFEVPFPYDAAAFDNRFPPFREHPPTPPELEGVTSPASGRAEIVLYTSRHDASFGELSEAELARVLAVWIDRSRALWSAPAHAYVAVFENRGAAAGATIAHPHGQIYALDHLPPNVAAKAAAHARRRAEGVCLSCASTQADLRSERIVAANGSFAVAVPFAARWPYEISVRALRHGARRLDDLSPAEQVDLLTALADVARRYDALFGFALPYMMVAQEAPRDEPDWHLAFEFYPLNRGPATVKIRASSETGLGLFLNDVAPEDAARQLRRLSVAAVELPETELLTVELSPPDAPSSGGSS